MKITPTEEYMKLLKIYNVLDCNQVSQISKVWNSTNQDFNHNEISNYRSHG